MGAMSPMGDAVTRLPARVARLRIWRDAKTHSILSSAGMAPPSACSRSVSVAAPPTHQPVELPSESDRFSTTRSGTTPSVETSEGKRFPFLLMSTPISVAPPTRTASGSSRKARRSPSSVVGRRKRSPFAW